MDGQRCIYRKTGGGKWKGEVKRNLQMKAEVWRQPGDSIQNSLQLPPNHFFKVLFYLKKLEQKEKKKKKGGGEQHARGEKKKKPASTRNRIKKDRKRDSCAR